MIVSNHSLNQNKIISKIIPERSGRPFYAIVESLDTPPRPPNKSKRFRVFLTSYRMIYLTCIHSQTSWTKTQWNLLWNLRYRYLWPEREYLWLLALMLHLCVRVSIRVYFCLQNTSNFV